ncbi:MarR family transcriptional regulator [Enterobacillus tribolii]|uniref:MarR family multiple antibiotic resistance transcriptional regulator n=1 Tax=Enterobacillus tribolii TaxID=1487935 RepID=A0A370QQS2_9GAMM|nr:MarR family transcriptional regulator [Enterobacillus tribolii]MBW7981676.1 MarR family transcriptional regulator [Enterobacillus tribolii]RDK91055.1 MarR family multiple antibiotic resistance transcriptional regulator [Enterobacillus tribolii]
MAQTSACSPEDIPLGRLIHQVNQYKDRLLTQILAAQDITASQFKVLASIHFEHCQTPVEISRLLSIDGGAMTRLLDRMVKKGLLKRQPAPDDKRKVLLSLTDYSEELCNNCRHQIAAGMHDILTERLSQEEVLQLKRLLWRLLPHEGKE